MNVIRKWNKYEKKNYIVRYLYYRRDQLSQRFLGHEYWPLPKCEAGQRLLSTIDTNKLIGEVIDAGNPYWIGRWGGTEMNTVFEYLKHDVYPSYDNRQAAIQMLCDLSGFFPANVDLGEKFVRMLLDCCKDIDLQAAWGRYMADYVYYQYQPNTVLTRLDRIEPWNMYKEKSDVLPWSAHLAGKKVLLIHPFAETIEHQYNTNREKIFSKIYEADKILPKFELKTIKAVQTLAGEPDERFKTWFDALDWMKEECCKVDFDVAIVGCGAYGYPLAAEIKKMGKIAIHLAGATQLMFGITGRRWETEYIYRDFRKDVINEYWVRPDNSEIIKNAKTVEGACYW